jgi:hypothetical protein
MSQKRAFTVGQGTKGVFVDDFVDFEDFFEEDSDEGCFFFLCSGSEDFRSCGLTLVPSFFV